MEKNYILVNARKESGLTQSELASLIGCKKTTVSNWENGYAKPRLSDAIKLASILRKSVDNIFFDV
ncbi:helix-turn-helix transcriptional regulator [Neobacillus sp. NRS-1170]|uniref:helix-turn-helix transcriptional regulator n=1 Tax=Neobacillus sp. NRS-1170 TaxID=3233898 RepID=UPI003D28A5F4